MAKIKVRKGMPSVQLDKQEFKKRFLARFYDPEFEPLRRELDKIVETAWVTYDEYHKSPRTRKAGKGFVDPDFDAPVEWLQTRANIQAAESSSQKSQVALADPDRQRLIAQRSDLPRRNVENLADGDAGETGSGKNPRFRSRYPRPVTPYGRIWKSDLSLQGMRLHSATALPLAVQLLSEPCSRPSR